MLGILSALNSVTDLFVPVVATRIPAKVNLTAPENLRWQLLRHTVLATPEIIEPEGGVSKGGGMTQVHKIRRSGPRDYSFINALHAPSSSLLSLLPIYGQDILHSLESMTYIPWKCPLLFFLLLFSSSWERGRVQSKFLFDQYFYYVA